MNPRLFSAVLLAVAAGVVLAAFFTPREYSSQRFLMDTFIEIKVYHHDSGAAEKAVASAFDEFNRIAVLTDRFPKKGTRAFLRSDVCRINSNAGIAPVEVSDDVFTLIKLSREYSQITGGAFDITVGPLMDLWGFGSEAQEVPADPEIKKTLTLVGSSRLQLNEAEKTVFLPEKGMVLDLGGIAKGYAVEKAAEVLRENGISRAVVNAGGNIYVVGGKGLFTPWNLGIQDPRSSSNIIGVLQVEDSAAVTSGDYQRYFEEDGRRYHHILDPQTGFPAGELASVTVVAPSSTEADILSTALFVMGLEKGMDLLEDIPHVQAVFVTQSKEIIVSAGLKDKVEISAQGGYSYDSNG